MRPPLKWVGGKRSLLTHIHALFPANRRGRFIEPFLGSGVVYLNTPGFANYLLADANQDLIDLYGCIRADSLALVDLVTELFGEQGDNTPDRYYEMREDFNTCPNGTVRRAALFVFLNRHGFNGLCRYNKNGLFNVPHGRSNSILNPIEAILNMSNTLNARPARLIWSDFRPLMALAGEGDTVYVDPPYLPLSPTAKFDSYCAGGFSGMDQADLASLAREAAERGALVVVSNHDTPLARELYIGATLVELQVVRSVGADAGTRKKAGELLAVFSPDRNGRLEVPHLAAA